MPNRAQSWSVWAKSRAVTSTSCPRARRSSITGRRTSTCGLFVRSIQTRMGDRDYARADLIAETTSMACVRLRTGLIGIARCVAAASSVPGSGAPAG
jgi:hypothetical protein